MIFVDDLCCVCCEDVYWDIDVENLWLVYVVRDLFVEDWFYDWCD